MRGLAYTTGEQRIEAPKRGLDGQRSGFSRRDRNRDLTHYFGRLVAEQDGGDPGRLSAIIAVDVSVFLVAMRPPALRLLSNRLCGTENGGP
jgi:hypothetical protein